MHEKTYFSQKTALEARISRLEDVLRFYADEECYKTRDSWCPSRGNIEFRSDIQEDLGEKAREALAEKEVS